MIQQIIYGILYGGVFALAAIGMSMMFGIVGLTNLAHGEFIILAAFLSSVLCTALGCSPFVTLIITVPVMFIVGFILQKVLINYVMGKGANAALLVTFGLSFILKDGMLQLFSADSRRMVVAFQSANIRISDSVVIPVLYLVVCLIGVAVIVILHLFMSKTYVGQSIRATSDDKVAAQLVGVNIKNVTAVAMGIALATAAVSGLTLGMPWPFYATSGSGYLLIAFGVVVLGGMGSMIGALVGGVIFGLAQVLGGSNWGVFISYIILLIFLAVRPQGLFKK